MVNGTVDGRIVLNKIIIGDIKMGEKHLLYPEEVKTLFINRIMCLHCNEIITSKHTHDFVGCKCGKCFVDGGQDYRRRGGEKDKDYEELSVWN